MEVIIEKESKKAYFTFTKITIENVLITIENVLITTEIQ